MHRWVNLFRKEKNMTEYNAVLRFNLHKERAIEIFILEELKQFT